MGFPRIVKVRQQLHGTAVENIEETVVSELKKIGLEPHIFPGMSIAITAGSRGIANIHLILRALVKQLQVWGAQPFLIPAMGSHGGATAEGQTAVLESLGVTEAFCGAPIRSSMEVERIGRTESGVEVYTDKHAYGADGIIAVNRIKPHTDFQSPHGFESGLMKMLAIGMGKHKQALELHKYGVVGIRDRMPDVARVVLDRLPILCALGTVENGREQTAGIEAIPPALIPEREQQLLKWAASMMPRLPVEDLDLLMVDRIGKHFSGTGMDTNIIGRVRISGVEEFSSPRIKYIIAGDLDESSQGNALGVGLADLTTKRLFNKIDFAKTNENVITSSFLHRGMIPIVLENDREALVTALRSNWGVEPEQARFARIFSTLHLEEMYVSESVLPDLENKSGVEVVGEPEEMVFDEQGNFLPWESLHH